MQRGDEFTIIKYGVQSVTINYLGTNLSSHPNKHTNTKNLTTFFYRCSLTISNLRSRPGEKHS